MFHSRSLAGFSFKMEHFTAEDYQALKNFTKTEKIPLDQNIYNNWDGKTLTINTDNFNLKSIEEAIKTGTTNFTELCKSTGAGLGCGSCKTEVKEILAKCK